MNDPISNDQTVLIREAVGVFHSWNDLQAAVDALMAHGFDRSELSLLASEKTVVEKMGDIYEKVSEIEDNPAVPRIAFIGRDSAVEGRAFAIGTLGYVGAVATVGAIVASGGTLAAAAVGAALAGGIGSMIGAVLSKTLGAARAEDIQRQLAKGGILLWVRTRDPAHEKNALDILTTHRAVDVHMHDLPAGRDPDHDPLADWTPDPFLPQARV